MPVCVSVVMRFSFHSSAVALHLLCFVVCLSIYSHMQLW